ncbi:MAG: hypothetical protein ACRCXA_00810 [Peptostreptococcaceae bacterium]
MKKISSIILPSIIILTIAFLCRADKYILVGLFLLFPITFIIQGSIYSNFTKELIIGFVLSSIAFIVPINLWYHMGSCIEFLVIYNVLGIISYFIKNRAIYRNKKSN